jgi:hypothetical protein
MENPSILMGVAKTRRAEYAIQAATLLHEAGRELTYDAVAHVSEVLVREDYPGLAQPKPTTQSVETRNDAGGAQSGVNPRGMNGQEAAEASIQGDPDPLSARELRANALQWAERNTPS